MKCVTCGAAELIQDVRDEPFTYKGQSTVILQLRGDFCPACGEVILDMAEAGRYSAAIRDFKKTVNAELTDPAFIIAVRKKLRLDQREASELFGGGINAFSRYETGKTKPPLALVQLLRLLDRHPELLVEVRRAS